MEVPLNRVGGADMRQEDRLRHLVNTVRRLTQYPEADAAITTDSGDQVFGVEARTCRPRIVTRGGCRGANDGSRLNPEATARVEASSREEREISFRDADVAVVV